jgi:hypothetical protein
MSTDKDENKSTKKTKLTKAIYALHTNLPRLELSLSEIGELKQKVSGYLFVTVTSTVPSAQRRNMWPHTS